MHFCRQSRPLNFEHFLSVRLFRGKKTFSRLIVRIAIAGIALGLTVMIVAVAVVAGFQQEVEEKISGFGGHIRIHALQTDNVLETVAILPDSAWYNAVKRLPGIQSIAPYGVKTGIVRSGTELEGIALKGVDSSYDWSFLRGRLRSGSIPNYADTANTLKVLVSSYTANLLGLKQGEKFLMYFLEEPLRKRKFQIAGIYNSGVQEMDKLYIIGDLRQVSRLNNWNARQVGGFELQCTSFSQMDTLTQTIYSILPEELTAVSARELYPQLFEWLELLNVNGEVIIVLMLLVAGINMISALLILILERTHTIGLLKALGSSSISIRKVFLYNAVYLICRGLLLGNLVGVGFCWIQMQYHVISLDEASYYMAYAPVLLKPWNVLWLNIGTLCSCLLLLVIPSMLVYRIHPVKAIRFQ